MGHTSGMTARRAAYVMFEADSKALAVQCFGAWRTLVGSSNTLTRFRAELARTHQANLLELVFVRWLLALLAFLVMPALFGVELALGWAVLPMVGVPTEVAKEYLEPLIVFDSAFEALAVPYVAVMVWTNLRWSSCTNKVRLLLGNRRDVLPALSTRLTYWRGSSNSTPTATSPSRGRRLSTWRVLFYRVFFFSSPRNPWLPRVASVGEGFASPHPSWMPRASRALSADTRPGASVLVL